MFNAYKAEPEDQVNIRILDVQAVASKTGPIQTHTSNTLPTEMHFYDMDSWNPRLAHWAGDIDFSIEPESQETIVVKIKIEITTPNKDPEVIELQSTFVPRKIPKSAWYFMPSA